MWQQNTCTCLPWEVLHLQRTGGAMSIPKNTQHAHLRHEIEGNVRFLVYLSLHAAEQLMDDGIGWRVFCIFVVLDVNGLYVISKERSDRRLRMTPNTCQLSLSLRNLITSVQQNVITVSQHNNTLISEWVGEEGARIANALPLVIEHFPLGSEIGSDIGFVIRQAQVEMAMRYKTGGHRGVGIAELRLVEEKRFFLPNLQTEGNRDSYNAPLFVNHRQKVRSIACLGSELLVHYGTDTILSQEGTAQ